MSIWDIILLILLYTLTYLCFIVMTLNLCLYALMVYERYSFNPYLIAMIKWCSAPNFKKVIYFTEYQLMSMWWVVYYYYTIMYDIKIMKAVFFMLLIVLSSTYLSLFERHIVAVMQQRVGPTATGLGLLQPLADAFKLLTKEPTRPHKSYLFLFRTAPIYTFSLAFTLWAVLPLSSTYMYTNIKHSIIVMLALLAINSLGVVMGAWSSHNKYAIFSAMRTIALTNSYGISISLAFLYPCLLSQSYNLYDIICTQQQTVWFIMPGLPISLLFWTILITEIKKMPFDVTESEAELGSGYLIEYSGMGFAIFILTEYCYLLIICILFTHCFLGGWLAPCSMLNFIPEIIWFSGKVFICLLVYFFARSTLPNLSFDYIMSMHWKFLFPLLFILVSLQMFMLSN